MDFETSKNLSGVGALLMFVGALTFPFATIFGAGAIGIVGLALLLAGLRGFAQYYKEVGIFNNALYAAIMAIVGVGAALAIAVVVLLDFLSDLGITVSSTSNISDLSTQITNGLKTASTSTIIKFAGFIFLDIVVVFVFALIASLLLRKSLNLLSAKTDQKLFKTTGTVLMVGGALTIVFLLGLILVWICMLLLAISFFSMRPKAPQNEMQHSQDIAQV